MLKVRLVLIIHPSYVTSCYSRTSLVCHMCHVMCMLQPGSSRPNTAPGKMQRPVRLKPIHSNRPTASLRRSSPYRPLDSSNENDQPLSCAVRPLERCLFFNRGCVVGCASRLRSSTNSVPPSLWDSPPCQMESNRRLTGLEASRGISPYCLPVINTFVTPVPPPTKRKEMGVKVTPSSAHRGRRLRLSTLTGAKVNEVPNSYTYCLLSVPQM